MVSVVTKLTTDDMLAIAAYLASLNVHRPQPRPRQTNLLRNARMLTRRAACGPRSASALFLGVLIL